MENEKKNSCCVSDLRIFAIAFLTAVIMIALYHLGLSYCRNLRRRACTPPPAKMLVMRPRPCAAAPQFGGPGCCCCRMNKPFPGKPGAPRMMRDGKGPMPHKFFKHRQMKGEAPKAPECAPKAQECAQEAQECAPKAEAPKAPAPAPEKK